MFFLPKISFGCAKDGASSLPVPRKVCAAQAREYFLVQVEKDFTRNGDVVCALYDVQEDGCFCARVASLTPGLERSQTVSKCCCVQPWIH
jgi:hypothetical protein